MIVQEEIEISGRDFIKTYSDKGMFIRGGVPEGLYAEAIDPKELGRVYVETDEPIPQPEDEGDAK